MDFFQAQQNARTSTFRLLVLFGLAIICLIIITDIFFFIAFGLLNAEVTGDPALTSTQFNPFILLVVSGVVMLIIVLASTYKSISLSAGGGRAIAESMGARLILPATTNFEEKRLMNVVEEMAIASGMPVPQVYILDQEHVINAFAAGLTTGDAIIGVTKGTVESLSRDELQGVIAHEYSHILNGDMSLNIQLIGLLHGILVIGIIGYFIIRSTGRSRSKDSSGFFIFGCGLIAIGFGGTFFGNLIKSSISRQREYLADASAVQFTRNPGGIGGALKKIGGSADLSRLKNEKAPEMSHMYFSQGVSSFLGSLTATPPPLEDRIRRIEPRWDGDFIEIKTSKIEEQAEPVRARAEKVGQVVTSAIVLQSVLNSISNMGNPGKEEIDAAREIIAQIPEGIHSAVHDPWGARAIIYCLLINRDETVRKNQLELIQANGDRGIYKLCVKYLPIVDEIPRRCRLAVIDMSLSSLREMSQSQYSRFKTNLSELIAADKILSLFEWCLQKVLLTHLGQAFLEAKTTRAKYSSYDEIKDELRLVFSVLAYTGHKKEDEAKLAFHAAVELIKLADLDILPKSEISLSKFDNCIEQLALLKPLLKLDLLKACLSSAMTDEVMTTREFELIRAIADTFNCPIPPVSTDD